MNRQHRVVLGVDGSLPSRAALAWAVEQAKLTDATVEAVITWQYPITFAGAPFAPIGSVLDTDFAAAAEQELDAAISETVDSTGPIKVSATTREGNPAKILLEAANGADLLVVGSRGHGGFTEALPGSVSQHCVHHAPCPVVIIRGAKAG
jgi:nucleotide-binding universal stress UspA family protein